MGVVSETLHPVFAYAAGGRLKYFQFFVFFLLRFVYMNGPLLTASSLGSAIVSWSNSPVIQFSISLWKLERSHLLILFLNCSTDIVLSLKNETPYYSGQAESIPLLLRSRIYKLAEVTEVT